MKDKKPIVFLAVTDNLLAKQLSEGFQLSGYKTVRAPLARDCYSAWSNPERFTVCVIDQHLADQPGAVLARYLAENKARKVVLFGKLDDAALRLELYRMGVSAIIRNPESSAEIVAAVEASLTRKISTGPPATVIPFPDTEDLSGAWKIKSLQRELQNPGGKTIGLTRNELKVCLAFAASKSEATNRELLCRSIYGRTDSAANRALDAVIKRLRQKIMAVSSNVDPITTHYGEGHRFTEPLVAVD